MSILLESAEFVKRQLSYHQRQVSKSHAKGAPTAHHGLARDFQVLLSFLESPLAAKIAAAYESGDSAGDGLDFLSENGTLVTPELIHDLPPELVEQLQISDTDRFQWTVLAVIERAKDKVISIEMLLIALFKASGKIYERLDLANRMYRMSKKGMVFPVPGKKGWYTTVRPEGAQLEIGGDSDEEDER